MVSYHKTLPESPTSAVPAKFEASSKKRKWEDPLAVEFFKDQKETERRKSILDIASDKWQQYPTVQSGFCKTRINMNTPEEPKKSPGPPSPAQMSLDLKLNLTCDQSQRQKADNYNIHEKQNWSSPGSLSGHDIYSTDSSKCKKDSDDISRFSSWLSSEGDHREMVATVCMRCHMLVMLRKSSPACPNCKFMHPLDQNPSTFLKRKCSLLC